MAFFHLATVLIVSPFTLVNQLTKNSKPSVSEICSNQVGFDYSLGVNRRSEDTMFNFNGVVKTDVGI